MSKELEAMAALGRFFQICIELANQDKQPIESNVGTPRIGSTEARKHVGYGRTKFNDLVQAGTIPSHMDGNKRMFYIRDLDNFNRRKAKE